MYPIFNADIVPSTKKRQRLPTTPTVERSVAMHIAKRRRLVETNAALTRMPVTKLLELMGNLTQNEIDEAQNHVAEIERNQLNRESRGVLNQMARYRGIAPSSHTKTSLIQAILETPELPIAPSLSEEQSRFVLEFLKKSKESPCLNADRVPLPDLLHAGPGTGKTTTLSHTSLEYMTMYPESRVLFLTYTRAGVQAIVERLGRETRRRQKLTNFMVDKTLSWPDVMTGCKKMHAPGVHVCSFHQYASKRIGQRDDDSSSSSYDVALARGTKKGPQSWEDWGLVIIDEAQDVISKFVTLINQVQRCARHNLVAGDPRQELYSGATYFSRLCSTPHVQIYYLQTNFRSTAEIVQTLNTFSQAHFGIEQEGIHKVQLPKGPQGVPKGPQGVAVSSVVLQVPSVSMEIIECTSFESQRELVVRACQHLSGQHLSGQHLSGQHFEGREGSACCISPVTVKKYKTGGLVAGIRQELFAQHNKMSCLLSDDKLRGDGDGIVDIGTSYGAKGQEWDRVVVIQGDIPYEAYNVMRDRLARLIYVALSRARCSLHILFTARPRETGMFADLAKTLGIRCSTRTMMGVAPMFKLPNELTVVDDLVQCAIPMEMYKVATFEPIETPATLAPDCLGLVVEHRLASYLNINIPDRLTVLPLTNQAPALFMLQGGPAGRESLIRAGIEPCRLEVLLGPGDSLEYPRVCIEPYGLECKAWESEWRDANLEKREFLLVKYSYSLLIATEWSLSDGISTLDLTRLEEVADLLRFQLQPSHASVPLVRSVLHRVPITGERPSMIMGYLIGEIDIEQPGTTVFEVKHVAIESLHAVHCRQALIYSEMMRKPRDIVTPAAYVVNTKLGTLNLVTFKDINNGPSDLWRIARAKLASKQAYALRVYLDNRRREKQRPVASREHLRFDLVGVAPVLISVDIEAYGGCVLEVGAVAFSKDDGHVLGVFHILANGVQPSPELEALGITTYTETGDDETKHRLDWNDKLAAVEALCGFAPINEQLAVADQNRVIESFRKWVEEFPEHTMLQYGGSDLALLQCTSSSSIDVMQYYRIFLEAQESLGLPYKLVNAVGQLYGPGCFVPHRAFEDAVATMQVFMAVTGLVVIEK
jgi:hypothetical protein